MVRLTPLFSLERAPLDSRAANIERRGREAEGAGAVLVMPEGFFVTQEGRFGVDEVKEEEEEEEEEKIELEMGVEVMENPEALVQFADEAKDGDVKNVTAGEAMLEDIEDHVTVDQAAALARLLMVAGRLGRDTLVG
jgi:hypothetical protein